MNDIRNLIKIKAFMYLELVQNSNHYNPSRRAGFIRKVTGSNSIYVLLGRWVKWGYCVSSVSTKYRGRPACTYCITRKGLKYLADLPKWYQGDIEAIRAEVEAKAVEIDILIGGYREQV